MIYIDDNSNDKTQVKNFILNKKENVKFKFRKERNLSTAFLDGVKISRGKYIVLMDADLQHHPEDINKLFKEIKKMIRFCYREQIFKELFKLFEITKNVVRLFLSKLFIAIIISF